MKIPKASSDLTKTFEELTPVSGCVSSKKMFGQPAAFANGNLFMGVFGDSLFVRLSEPDCEKARETAGFAPFEPMPGRAMRAYWVLPPSIVKNRIRAREWVARSLDYAITLPPKERKGRSKSGETGQ